MKKKLLSLLLAVAMVISLAACEKKPVMGKDATATEPVVIVHTNDVHGAIQGYAKVAALADKYEAEGAYVLVLDAGDYSQGDPAVNVSEGATAIEMMNMAGYDAVALGNHEFDYGFETLKKNMESAQFPVRVRSSTLGSFRRICTRMKTVAGEIQRSGYVYCGA